MRPSTVKVRVVLQIGEKPATYEDQMRIATEAFGWTDAVSPSTIVNKAAQMWYYGLSAAKVCCRTIVR